MRESLDLRSILIGAGAVLLLLSLFLEWYEPGLEAWTVFEVVDVLLLGLAAAALAALAPGAADGLRRALPWLCLGAFVLVLVQVVDAPPAASGADRAAGAWIALAATALMGAGALLAAARISVSVDVQGRERRRRAQAVDARGAGAAATASGGRGGGRLDRLFSQGDPTSEGRAQGAGAVSPRAADDSEPDGEPRTQPMPPVPPEQRPADG